MSLPDAPEPLPPGAVFLDLEIAEDGLRVGAMLSEDQPWMFGPEHLHQAMLVIPRVPLLAGHNLRRFDLPQLHRLTGVVLPPDLDARVVDTLELGSLAFPGEPSQALDKLYRDHAAQSDPVEDCRESARVYQRCVPALRALPPLVRAVAHRLLPAGGTRDLIPEGDLDWASLSLLPLHGDWTALQAYLTALPAHNWTNFGALVFLNWLFHADDASCRRPAWVTQTFPSFESAERAALPQIWSEATLTRELVVLIHDTYWCSFAIIYTIIKEKKMALFDPAHPGEVIRETLEGLREETAEKFTIAQVAAGLGKVRPVKPYQQSLTASKVLRLKWLFV